MASPNSTFTEMVTTTLRNRSKQIHDNVSNNNALLMRLNQKGRKRIEDGGRSIVCELDYQENSTYQRYSGYDTLNIGASDVLSAAEYDWMQSAVNVTASGRQIRMNTGKTRMINLVKSRINNAVRTFKNNISSDIYSDGALPNQITGLQAMVAETNTNTVGGISGNTYSFWRNVVQNPSSPIQGGGSVTVSKSTIRTLMDHLWLELNRGGDKPDLIIMSNEYYGYYWESLQDLQRYTQHTKAVDGFSSLQYVTADVMYDGGSAWGSGITATTAYFLNTDYLELVVHKDADMSPLPDKVSTNQDAVVYPLIMQCNLAMSNRKLQGIML